MSLTLCYCWSSVQHSKPFLFDSDCLTVKPDVYHCFHKYFFAICIYFSWALQYIFRFCPYIYSVKWCCSQWTNLEVEAFVKQCIDLFRKMEMMIFKSWSIGFKSGGNPEALGSKSGIYQWWLTHLNRHSFILHSSVAELSQCDYLYLYSTVCSGLY